MPEISSYTAAIEPIRLGLFRTAVIFFIYINGNILMFFFSLECVDFRSIDQVASTDREVNSDTAQASLTRRSTQAIGRKFHTNRIVTNGVPKFHRQMCSTNESAHRNEFHRDPPSVSGFGICSRLNPPSSQLLRISFFSHAAQPADPVFPLISKARKPRD